MRVSQVEIIHVAVMSYIDKIRITILKWNIRSNIYISDMYLYI